MIEHYATAPAIESSDIGSIADSTLLTAASDDAAWRMHFERQLRGWSTGEITWRAAVDSCPAARQAAWPAELSEPRRRTVLDEPVTIGQVLGLLALTD